MTYANRFIGSFMLTSWVAAVSYAGMSMRTPDIAERAQGAATVVVAHAKSVTPRFDTNSFGDKLIISRIELTVEETLKGSGENTLSMDLEGGSLNGLTLRVSDLPEIHTGDRAVFFLDRGGSNVHQPHLRGLGILKLDKNNRVEDSPLSLDDVRAKTRGAKP